MILSYFACPRAHCIVSGTGPVCFVYTTQHQVFVTSDSTSDDVKACPASVISGSIGFGVVLNLADVVIWYAL